MSRSRKAPYYVDNTCKKWGKKFANRRVRHGWKSRNRWRHIYQNSLYKNLYERWDIIDYVFFCPDDPKAYRK